MYHSFSAASHRSSYSYINFVRLAALSLSQLLQKNGKMVKLCIANCIYFILACTIVNLMVSNDLNIVLIYC